MLKIIKHGNTVHTYKCPKCSCIFIASKRDIENEDINGLLYCPECGYYISEDDIIDDRAIIKDKLIKDKLFEKVNVPSCWKVGEHDKKYEAMIYFCSNRCIFYKQLYPNNERSFNDLWYRWYY